MSHLMRARISGSEEEQMHDPINRRGFRCVGVLRRALPGLLILLPAMHPAAQTPLPPPAQAMDMTAMELQAMVKAYPGGNAEIKSIDAGKHVVDLWLEQRKAGTTTPTGTNGIAHSEITEIYYIVQGRATLVTGGTLTDPRLN